MAPKLGYTANVDGGGGKGLPDDGLADVGGDEQVDAGSETVTFLKEFDEEDEGSDDSWMIRRRQTPAPRSLGWPYKPVRMYTVA